MHVYLLRHGQAEQNAAHDSLRELSHSGTEAISSIAKSFTNTEHFNFRVDRCFVSPLIRAQQTAKLFISGSGLACSLESENILKPESDAYSVYLFLEKLDEQNTLLIGHNPLLSELHMLLTSGKRGYPEKIMAAGELCVLSFESLGIGLGEEVLNILPGKK